MLANFTVLVTPKQNERNESCWCTVLIKKFGMGELTQSTYKLMPVHSVSKFLKQTTVRKPGALCSLPGGPQHIKEL